MKNVFTKCRKWYIINASGGKTTDRKAVKNLNKEINEGMTDKEFQAVLEAIKEYAQETQSIEKTIALIERMQGKEKELTSGMK